MKSSTEQVTAPWKWLQSWTRKTGVDQIKDRPLGVQSGAVKAEGQNIHRRVLRERASCRRWGAGRWACVVGRGGVEGECEGKMCLWERTSGEQDPFIKVLRNPSASLGTAVGGQTQWSPADSNRSSHLRDLSASLSPLTLPSSFSFSTFSFFILFLNPLISIFISTSHGSVSIYVLPCFPAKVNLNCDTGVSGTDFFNLNSNEELSLSLLQSTCLIAA